MDTNLQDAESRLSRLMADFYEILDRLNMEDVVQVEPKKVVGYLVEALRLQAFRSVVTDELGRQAHKPTKASIQMFLKWLRQELEGFMRFEAHIASQSPSTYGGKGSQTQASSSHQKKSNSGSVNISRAPEKSSNSQSKPSNARKGGHDARPKPDKQDKKYFKCGDQTHGVFQCPDIASPVEAKELYEQSTGRKVVKPVLAVTADGQDAVVSSAAIAGMVMEAVETSVTPDSAAEVSIITTKSLRALSDKGTWLTHLKIPGQAAVTGIGDKSVPVTSKVKLDLRFNTPGGPLVLRNVICWVTEGSLPAGVGDLLFSRWITQRLGYSPEKLLAAAQQQQFEWDLNDIDDRSTGSVARIMAYSGTSKPQQRANEELVMEEDEDRACFPTFVDDADAERELIRSILLEKVEEARRSILTEEGVITPTSVLMGGTNSVAYVQSTVQQMFAEMFNNDLLIWIDDLLGYDDSDMGLPALLKKVLTICAEKGLKRNPKKCSFYLREALWCGRVVSGEGVRHDPRCIEALTNLSPPTTGQELQQFVCALNWMRTSIPACNKLVQPLVDPMEKVYVCAGGRKKTQERKILLSDAGWTETEEACLVRCKEALQHALQLAHPDPAKRLLVFTDASDEHWGATISQVSPDQVNRPLSERDHEPQLIVDGTFSGAAQRWAIVEKEAYAIIETCRRADYLLHRHDGFSLFTDHRNLRYIFDPHSVSAAVPKYTADKLHRWALLLMGYTYEIHDIAGDNNVWADLLSRWGSSFRTVCAIRQVPLPLSPQLDETFVWPTLSEVISAQQAATPPSEMV